MMVKGFVAGACCGLLLGWFVWGAEAPTVRYSNGMVVSESYHKERVAEAKRVKAEKEARCGGLDPYICRALESAK